MAVAVFLPLDNIFPALPTNLLDILDAFPNPLAKALDILFFKLLPIVTLRLAPAALVIATCWFITLAPALLPGGGALLPGGYSAGLHQRHYCYHCTSGTCVHQEVVHCYHLYLVDLPHLLHY